MFDNSRPILGNQLLAGRLAAFGIGQVEARIYLHLLNKQPKSMLEIARDLDLPRTSVYDSALKLSEKGLVERIVKFKSQKLRAYPISILQTYVDKEKTRLDDLEDTIAALERDLSQDALAPLASEVRYYHGVKGIQQLIWNNLRAEGEIVGYTQFGLAKVVGRRFADKHASKLLDREIATRYITNPEFLPARYPKLDSLNLYRQRYQQCRLLDRQQLYVSGDTMIYNNIVATNYWQQGEYIGIEIENAEMAKTHRSIFELLWRQATPCGG